MDRFAVTVVPDNDAAGHSAGDKCSALAKVIYPPVGDANDYQQAGGDLVELLMQRPAYSIAKAKNRIRKQRKWLIYNILRENKMGAIYGQYSSGKSYVAVDIAMSVASGRDYLGQQVKKGPVLYHAGEDLDGVLDRCDAWCVHNKVEFPENFHYNESALYLNDAAKMQGLVDVLTNEVPDCKLLVIDTWNRVLNGEDEQSNDSRYLNALGEIMLERGLFVLIVHHAGKDVAKGPRGGSSFGAGMDHMYSTVVDSRRHQLILVNEKKKGGKIEGKWTFDFLEVPLGEGQEEENGDLSVESVLIRTANEVDDTSFDGLVAKLSGQNKQVFDYITDMQPVQNSILTNHFLTLDEHPVRSPHKVTSRLEAQGLIKKLDEKSWIIS